MCCICEKTKQLVDDLMDRFREFDVWDVAAFKVCLVSFGVLTGAYFYKTMKKLRWVLWLIFGTTYLYVMWRLFSNE